MKPTSVTLRNVRLSYPNLFRAKGSNLNPEPRFSADVLVKKDDAANYNALLAAIEAAKAEGVEKCSGWKGKMPAKLSVAIKDGDGENNPEYKGCWVVRVWSKEAYPPKVMDSNFAPIIDQSEIYGGVIVDISINMYAYSFNSMNGINASFDAGVVKRADGDAFGGGARTSAEEAFGAPVSPLPSGGINPITGLPY